MTEHPSFPRLLRRHYPESGFGGFSDIDGTVAFYCRVRALIGPDATVVDFGCGRGRYVEDSVRIRRELRDLRQCCKLLVGLDVDPHAEAHPQLDRFFQVVEGGPWPIQSGSVDLLLSDMSLEHVQNPGAFFEEAARVLRAGGHLCIRTTNASSYVGLASRLLPQSIRRRALTYSQPARMNRDVFPVAYRCNTISQIRRQLDHIGFEHCVYGYEAEPAYLAFNDTAFRLGSLYQRLAPRRWATSLFAFARLAS